MGKFCFPVIPLLAPPVHVNARMDILHSIKVLLLADQLIQATLHGTSEILHVKVGFIFFSDVILNANENRSLIICETSVKGEV